MFWHVWVVVGVILITLSPQGVLSQVRGEGTDYRRLLAPQSAQGSGARLINGMTFEPQVDVGWKKLAISYSVNNRDEDTARSILENRPADLELRDANFWIGRLGVTTRAPSGLEMVASASGAVPKTIAVLTPVQPDNDVSVPRAWNSRDAEWWTIEGGASYPLSYGVAVAGSVLFNHFLAELCDPWPPTTNSSIDYFGDFRVKTFAAYLGVQLEGSNFRAVLSRTPLALCSVRLAYRDQKTSAPDLESAVYETSGWGYALRGQFDYTLNLPGALQGKVWLDTTLERFRTGGDYTVLTTAPVFVHESGQHSLGRHSYALGISMLLPFVFPW